jgi:hypothetical protein
MVSGIGESIQGNNLFIYCFNNPIMMSDPSGHWPTSGTILKAIAIAAVIAVVVLAVVATVATFGAASIVGTIAITSAITLAAKATEVAVLQTKKGVGEGNNSEQIAGDVINSVFDNGSRIVGMTPLTKTAGYASGFYSQSDTIRNTMELLKLDGANISQSSKNLAQAAGMEVANRFTNLRACMAASASKGSMFVSYGFAAYQVGNMTISIFSDNPKQRAAERGYSLR